MSDTVIKVEHLSKQYRLGQVGTGSLSHDINRAWHRLRGKEDPYLKIGEENDRTTKGSSDYVWALRDINFEVKHGEVLGIIGRNGAGKSTLLKILSRTTKPTTGSIKIKGRVASLLEVGTGFHPELSGRDNIFLNGAILGMTKQEIKSKFDEIVDFAGVEKYIDTPVKRYSSGMYVRLAFAVAAHLEPEILIVDEVLAVGDAEFQKKALGKMKDVSNREGRTVLFVSHNMDAIQNLCDTGLLLYSGRTVALGNISDVLESYLSTYLTSNTEVCYSPADAPGNESVSLLRAMVDNPVRTDRQFFTSDPILFIFEFLYKHDSIAHLDVTYHLFDERGTLVYVGSTFFHFEKRFGKGTILAKCSFPAGILIHGNYTIGRLLVVQNGGTILKEFRDVISFDIMEADAVKGVGRFSSREGIIKPSGVSWQFSSSL